LHAGPVASPGVTGLLDAVAPPAAWGLGGLTRASWALLAAAAAVAVVDWWAVGDHSDALHRRVEYVAKPAVLLALIGVAATLRTPLPTVRGWFLAGLALCLLGDVFLMLPGERTEWFGAGLGAFLAGHVCFLVGLAEGDAPFRTAAIAFVVIVAGSAVPARAVIPGAVRHAGRAIVAPLVVYMVALAAMAGAAWSLGLARTPPGGDALLAAGGSLFVVSDTVLAVNRFVRRLPRGDVVVHVTYHLAVAALVLGLAGRG
jgi:uncharacterized membrane protein YhhN